MSATNDPSGQTAVEPFAFPLPETLMWHERDEHNGPALDWLNVLICAPIEQAVATLTPHEAKKRLPGVFSTLPFDSMAERWLAASLELLVERKMPAEGSMRQRLDAAFQTPEGQEFADRLAILCGAICLGHEGPGRVRGETAWKTGLQIDFACVQDPALGLASTDLEAMMTLARAMVAERHASTPWVEASGANKILGSPDVWQLGPQFSRGMAGGRLLEFVGAREFKPLPGVTSEQRIRQARERMRGRRTGSSRWSELRVFSQEAADQASDFVENRAPHSDAALEALESGKKASPLALVFSAIEGPHCARESSWLAERALLALERAQLDLLGDFDPLMFAHRFDAELEEVAGREWFVKQTGLSQEDARELGPLFRARWAREARENAAFQTPPFPPAALAALDAPARQAPAPVVPPETKAQAEPAPSPASEGLNLGRWRAGAEPADAPASASAAESLARRIARRLGLG
jgi:hypothetical protein